MGWAIGHSNGRDIGYGVPAVCDKPGCNEEIDRGLSFCCGGYISDYGCGLYFCDSHLQYRTPRGETKGVQLCPRCYKYRRPYEPKPDVLKWLVWKLVAPSWETWRQKEPDELRETIEQLDSYTLLEIENQSDELKEDLELDKES